MNKLMMTAASLALMGFAVAPAMAQSTPSTDAPAVTAPNNSSTTLPQDTAPMSSKDSTSAVAPTQGSAPSSADTSDSSAPKATKTSHKPMHHKQMDTTKASGSKSTDHDAEQLNEQELGKVKSQN